MKPPARRVNAFKCQLDRSSSRHKDASIEFFFGDGTDDFEDGNNKRSLESSMSVLIQFPIILDHLERILQVSEECITDQPTDQRTARWTDQRTDGPTNLLV